MSSDYFDISFTKNISLERPIVRDWFFYEKLEIVENQPIPIFRFKNVHISPGSKNAVRLKGQWNIVTDGFGQYGHFMKEGIGQYLYCKQLFSNLQPLFLHVYSHDTPEYLRSIVELCFNRIKKDLENQKAAVGSLEYVEFKGPALHHKHFIIDELIVMMDNGRLVFAQSFPNFWEARAPHLSRCLVDYFNDLRVYDFSKPKKIFITRRNRSKELDKRNQKDDFWYKNRFIDDNTLSLVESIFAKHGYEIIDFSGMTLHDQISYSYNSTHFAGFLGTAFHNGIWCKPGTKFYGLRATQYNFDWKHDIIHTVEESTYSLIDIWKIEDVERVELIISKFLTKK